VIFFSFSGYRAFEPPVYYKLFQSLQPECIRFAKRRSVGLFDRRFFPRQKGFLREGFSPCAPRKETLFGNVFLKALKSNNFRPPDQQLAVSGENSIARRLDDKTRDGGFYLTPSAGLFGGRLGLDIISS
jgi:hypothetical protein